LLARLIENVFDGMRELAKLTGMSDREVDERIHAIREAQVAQF
jgi:hypothetical protein